MAYNALIHMTLQCDELRFQLVTLVAHTSAVMSLVGNSSRFNVLIYSLLYTVVTSDEFFYKNKIDPYVMLHDLSRRVNFYQR